MKHRSILSLLTLLLPFALCTATVVNGYHYNFFSDKNRAYFTGFDESLNVKDLVIPEYVEYDGNTYTVTQVLPIYKYKINGKTETVDSLGSLVIPKTVEEISTGAYKFKLHTLVIEDSDQPISMQFKTTYGNSAIIDSVYLGRDVTPPSPSGSYPMKVLSIAVGPLVKNFSSTFQNISALERVDLSNAHSLNRLYSSFYHCTNLKSIWLPSNLSEMSGSTFSGCTSLKSIILPNGLDTFSPSTFYDCASLQDLYLGEKIKQLTNSFSSLTSLRRLVCFSDEFESTKYQPIETCTVYAPDATKYQSIFSANTVRNIIEIVDKEYEYTGKLPEFPYTNNATLVDVEIEPGTLPVGAGTHVEKIGFHFTKNDWEAHINVPHTYTIKKAPLQVFANNVSRCYGEEDGELSLSYVGFKNGETEEVISEKPRVWTSATKESLPGTYQIFVSGGSADNYEMSYQTGTLTITKAKQVVNWEQTLDDVLLGREVEISATSNTKNAVIFASSDESVAKIVSRAGKTYVVGTGIGECDIYAYQEGTELYEVAEQVVKHIAVSPVKAESVALNYNSLSLNIGGSVALKATVTPNDVTTSDVVWTSSNEDIATVSNGEVSAVGVGEVVITATTTDGTDICASCTITVNPVKAVDLVLSDSKLELVEGGMDILVATITPSNATYKNLTWTSSNENVATVENGVVTATGVGVAVITATTTDGSNLSVSCKVTVKAAPATSVSLSESELSIFPGDEVTLTGYIDNKVSTNFTWRSSDTSIAIVNNGVVTAVGVGTATIIATAADGSGLSAQCRVTVTPIMVSLIQLNISDVEVAIGESVQLSADVYPTTATTQQLVWSSSNSAIATVSNNGLVLTVSAGTAIITASATDGSGVKADCKIVVKGPDAIEDVKAATQINGIYDASGRKLTKLNRGVNIIRMSDGKTRKVIVK